MLTSSVGYNLFNPPLRDEILGFMKLLNGAAPNKPHNLYKELACQCFSFGSAVYRSLGTPTQKHGAELQLPSKGLQRVRH